jgi:hypothetical protein
VRRLVAAGFTVLGVAAFLFARVPAAAPGIDRNLSPPPTT